MKKIKTFLGTIVAASAVFAIVACGGKAEDTENATTPTTTEKVAASDAAVNRASKTNIVYVNIDTINSRYQLAIDYAKRLDKRSADVAAELEAKAKAWENDAMNFERRVQNNELSRNQIESQQAALAKRQQDIVELEARYRNELSEAAFNAQKEYSDSVIKCLNEYNAIHKYDFILTKGGGQDCLPIANPEFDITNDILTILNSNYKSINE